MWKVVTSNKYSENLCFGNYHDASRGISESCEYRRGNTRSEVHAKTRIKISLALQTINKTLHLVWA